MNINITDARGIFTKTLIAMYRERPVVFSFLRSFFPSVETSTKEISIEVQRGTERVAVDVLRGTEGNRNTFSRSTEKIFIPPYYREYFDATDLDFYDLLFGQMSSGQVSGITFAEWVSRIVEKLGVLQDKIERAYELQCAQVLLDGIVQLTNGDNIDFKRKAASLINVDTAGEYWNVAGSTPIEDLKAGCKFLRETGKSQGGTFNLICGGNALEALINHADIKDRSDLKDYDLNMIHEPQRNSVGATLHGRITVGSYKVNLWTYPEIYEDSDGNATPYIDKTKCILLPEVTKFKLTFASVPMLYRDKSKAEFGEFIKQERAAYVIGNYTDDRTDKHIFDIKSAGVAIPVAVDQIYTLKVLA